MKRIILLLLTLVLALSLASCSKSDDIVAFYYARYDDAYTYGTENAVIAPEYRDVTGHTKDLKYLLTLYFHGPTSEHLRSPFPSGISLRSVVHSSNTLFIELTPSLTVLNGTDLTLACACLARTSFALTDAEAVTISAQGLGFVSMTLTRDSLMLSDDTPIP